MARYAMVLACTLVLASAASAQTAPEVELFSREGCPHCERAREWAEALEARGAIELIHHDVADDRAALERLVALARAQGVAPVAVPAMLARGRLFVGFDVERGRAIEAWLESGETSLAPSSAAVCAPSAEEPCEDSVRLPMFGEVRASDLGLPLFTIALGLIDGFNPCAMWVLLFLLSMLVHLRDRRRMALIAGTFVIVSALAYYAFMAAWLELHLVLGISRAVQIAIGVFAIAVATVHLKDFVALGHGPSLSIPESAKPGIYARARAILRAEHLGAAMAMVVALAFVVNLVELLCTAGLPALYTHVLASHGLPRWQHYAYLALYDAAYMADDALMVAIGVITLSQRKLQERGGRWLKLISGIVIGALGLALIFAPELLVWR